MKLSDHQFTATSMRLIAAAAFAVSLSVAPGLVLAAVDADAHAQRAELRIKDMHAKLQITAAQEGQWTQVAQTMHDNAKTMDSLTQARISQAKTMTAVDDLKSYGEITEAHAEGLRKFTPVFASLYSSMSDPQKKAADNLFRHGDRTHSSHKHGHRRSKDK